ncbi:MULTISPECIES: hypothetical protein [unclassified Pseudoalteromonas]|uniref:hypothetical protein n=1 Tax=unclassified Pseudoalteromonas TaxID=194690 RepID=UPI001B3A05CB|nr:MULTISPECIES: hypothetical protein [unclassified Pseudoalteromonas]MBQ4846646.1 hypothetical protein [Pseudoalteromonas sp. MMG005]MBQ4851662.1 hypothetical protein [Pseudoalteromonas sp. MMG012]
MRTLLLIISVLFILPCNAKPYTINASEALSYQLGQQQVTAIMTEIYQPLNIVPEVIFLPSYRGLKNVDQGLLDAEGGRVDVVMTTYKNVIKIPTPIAQSQLAIFCLKPHSCQVNLKDPILRIHGNLIAEHYCAKKDLSCTAVQNDISAFQALVKEQANILLANSVFPSGSLCTAGIKKVYIKLLHAKPHRIYHYVHQRHVKLVSALDASIKALHHSGKLQALIDTLLQSFAKCGGEVIKLPQSLPIVQSQ